MSLKLIAEECCRCGLTGQIMQDPVIVTTKNDPYLIYGASYERKVLVKYASIHSPSQPRGMTKQYAHTTRAPALSLPTRGGGSDLQS